MACREQAEGSGERSRHEPGAGAVRIGHAGPEVAAIVHRVTQQAFAEYVGVLNPPSSAPAETLDDVIAGLGRGGALLAWEGEVVAGCARYVPGSGHLHVSRVSVLPGYRRRGIATALMRALEAHALATGYHRIHLGARLSLPSNIALYSRLGYRLVTVEAHPRGPDCIVTFFKDLPAHP